MAQKGAARGVNFFVAPAGVRREQKAAFPAIPLATRPAGDRRGGMRGAWGSVLRLDLPPSSEDAPNIDDDKLVINPPKPCQIGKRPRLPDGRPVLFWVLVLVGAFQSGTVWAGLC